MTTDDGAGGARSSPGGSRGDTNAFFGLGFNTLVNVLVLSGLCLGVVHIPGTEVFGVILPALGVAAADRQRLLHLPGAPAGRAVRAAPTSRRCRTGRRVPHMFIVVFVIMLPIYLQTNDPLTAWAAGLAWCVHHRHHRADRRVRRPVHPQVHAAGGDARHARGHLDRVHLDAAGRADVARRCGSPCRCMVIILIGFFTDLKLPGNIPVGLAALLLGTAIAGSAGTCPRRT